ncbi:MAG: HAE1 family hydrophobic/amphiphilic exporter-1, partial [Lentimonas sp.]
GLSSSQILNALRDANLDLPAGQIEEGRYQLTLRAPAQFKNVDEIRNTVVALRNGVAVCVGDVAAVLDTYEKPTRYIRVNGGRGIRIAIRKQASANTVEVSQKILSEIDAINREFPQIEVVPVINQGNFIQRSIQNVARSVVYGGGLAVLILIFFLRSFRSTLIISLSIPISIIATFSLIYFGGLTINLMTLGGLALGVGMMVDSSIVVLENIFRRRDELQEAPAQAASEGAQEVAPAILASTITTLVIFLPVVFVQGVSSLLFRELAYVIVFSLICSLLISLSLVPMLASRLIQPKSARDSAPKWVQFMKTRSESIFNRINQGYSNLLKHALQRPLTVVLVSLGIFMLSLLLYPFIGSEFLPPSDEGEVRVTGEMEVGTRLDLVDEQTRLMETIVYAAVPEAISSVASVSGDRGEIRLSLVPASQRQRSNTEIANDLRQRLAGKIPGMKIRTRAPQGQFLLERIVGGSVEGVTIEIRGFDLDTLNALSAQVAQVLSGVEGVTDVDESYDAGTPQLEFIFNRQKIADMGFSPRDVTELIETAIAGSLAGNFNNSGNSYRIFVQLKDAERRSSDEVLNLTLQTADGENVALRNLVETRSSRAPMEIRRKDQQRQVTVMANVSGRDLGSVAAEVEEQLAKIPRPSNFELRVAGNFEEQQESFRELVFALLLALLLVFMVLACQYESLRDPIVVMFSTPLAAIGVLVTLYVTGTTLNLQSGIGCIMLGGIVVNNAILLVDQASRLVACGSSVFDAACEAGRRRFRPILMTSLTTILGLLPLALGIGEGAEAQAPLARAVVGGLIGSTAITLFLIPVVYTLIHRNLKPEAAL